MLERLHKSFPTYGESNIFWYYLVSLFSSAWFQVGNWLIFVLLFMTETQFAYVEAISFGLGLFIEIPSGAFADLLGKRRSIIIGIFMQAIGSVFFIFGYVDITYFWIGNILIIASFAFQSGSIEALVYDTLVEKDKVEHYDNIIGKAKSLGPIAIAVAGLIGGLLWRFSIYLPLSFTAAFFFIAAFMSFKFIEPSVDTDKFSFPNFIKQNKRGFHYLFKSNFRTFTFSFAMIAGTYLMWHVGVVRVLMGRDFGYDGETLNYLISITMLVGAATSYAFAKIRNRLSDKVGMTSVLAISSVAWLLAGMFTNSLVVGFIVFMVITIAGQLGNLWSSVVFNSHVDSKDRATAISTLSLLVQIPYVITVIIFSDLVENGGVEYFYYVVAGLLAVGTLSYFLAIRKDEPKSS